MAVVGIFGGSFSPIHEGHITVAREVASRGLVDQVWLMPCKRNPLKDGSTTMPDSERLRLIEEAITRENESAGKELLRLCDIELGMPDPSYTADTLRELRKKYPEFTFRLIAGADSYLNFEKWKEWDWIESNFNPIAYPRPGYQLEETRKGWTLIKDAEQVDISSTQLREKLNSQSEK